MIQRKRNDPTLNMVLASLLQQILGPSVSRCWQGALMRHCCAGKLRTGAPPQRAKKRSMN
jgi:hypothetical protein